MIQSKSLVFRVTRVRSCASAVPCHKGVAQGHSPELTQPYRPFQDRLVYGEDRSNREERFEVAPFSLGQPMVSKHLDIANGGHGRRAFPDEAP